jgi:hypothetical protein
MSDDDAVALDPDVFVQLTQHGIVLREMGERFRVRKVVHGDELDLGIVKSRANNVAANTAEAVDAYFDRHCWGVSPSGIRSYGDLNHQDSRAGFVIQTA